MRTWSMRNSSRLEAWRRLFVDGETRQSSDAGGEREAIEAASRGTEGSIKTRWVAARFEGRRKQTQWAEGGRREGG